MKKLLFIPLHYMHNPHKDWYKSFCDHFQCMYYTDMNSAIEFKPDFIFCQSSVLTKMDMVVLKSVTGAFVMQWTGDCREELLPEVVNYAGVSDITFLACGIAQKKMYEDALKQPVFYLQHAVSPFQFLPVISEIVDKKVIFIGNNYDQFPGAVERNQLCSLLTSNFSCFEVWGNGYNLPEYRNPNSIAYLQTPTLYNNAYVSISANIYNDKEGYYSNRPLDIMAAGSCCLMRYSPNLERWFNDMQDCVFYKSNEEACERIQFLLDNPEKRNKIALRGQMITELFHSYDHRVLEIVQTLKSIEK